MELKTNRGKNTFRARERYRSIHDTKRKQEQLDFYLQLKTHKK
jgi:hypothetical protein